MQPGADQQTIPMLLTTIGREQHCNNRLTIHRLKHDLLKGVVAQRNEKRTNSNPISRTKSAPGTERTMMAANRRRVAGRVIGLQTRPDTGY